MKPFFILAVSLAISLSLEAKLFAHGGNSHALERNWTLTNSKTPIQGCFVYARDGLVHIRCSDNALVSLSLSDLSDDDQQWVKQRLEKIRKANDILRGIRPASGIAENGNCETARTTGTHSLCSSVFLLPMFLITNASVMEEIQQGVSEPEMARAFDTFVQKKSITTRWDKNFFYVQSNGIPDHPMMVGITAWQQQVPLPQAYLGDNAWQVPLNPVPAKNPKSTKGDFLRGAIALAVNGVPIFNPLNNRGEDAYLFGELDEFGGHCGRADDYHYHLAPTHLEPLIGKGLPIAYSLDGYPIYGYEEFDGSAVINLDKFNGHQHSGGQYHYHATKKYPYLNGGFHGEVTQRSGQVEPQPRSQPMRPALSPLRGAKITDFQQTQLGSYQLTYDVQGKKGTVSYTINSDGSFDFVFVGTNGKTTNESYKPNQTGRGPNRTSPPSTTRKE